MLARLNTAWGVFLSVAVSAVVGWLLLLALTWSIPPGDVARTAADPYPVLYIVYSNVGRVLAHTIAVVIGGAMWLCGVASVTSMARMWYAFARDDGMPGASIIKRVSTRSRAPVAAIVVTSVLSIVICVYAAAYSVVTSISTITLYLAYGIPIYLNWRARRRGDPRAATRQTAPWNLGRWGTAVNALALGWVAVIAVIFSLPPNELVLWTMLLVGALLLAGWQARARHRFRGPASGPASPQAEAGP
jgi:amino acid transporter